MALIAGVHAQTSVDHCFSHASAALLHGLPLWLLDTTTHLYQRSSPSGRRRRDVVRHVPMPPAEDRVVVLGSVPATSVTRTVWDSVSTMRPLGGLVVADGALHRGLDLAELHEKAAAAIGRRGVARARAVLELADGGAESPWESASRYALLRAGFPVPQTQIPVETRLGTFWADLGWEEWRVLVEYDGRTKYLERGAEELVREKRRHDAVLEAGWRVVRVTREDFRLPGSIAARVAPLLPHAVTERLRPRPALA
ncbi:hypothetical protein [Cellulomonas sp.]|uniref:hypothetical protein n=1 Tax=Cellulomonas sp. TaxID=40001 RepID=UPI003BAB9161